MADAALPTGPAPRGFWKSVEAEGLLTSVVLAMMPKKVFRQLDFTEVARVVGEGKLSKRSAKAKLTQLRERGRQRIADSQIRLRADDENAVPHDPPRNEPAGRDARRENAELNDTSSRPSRTRPENAAPRGPPENELATRDDGREEADSNDTNSLTSTTKSRKRKRDAADELTDTTERQKKQKKKKADDLPGTTERQKKQKKKNVKRKEQSRLEAKSANEASTSHPADQSESRLTSEEITPASEGLLQAPERQTTDGNLVKREVENRNRVRPNPALQSKGQCEKSAIVIEDLGSDDEVADEYPAEPRGGAARETLPPQGTRGPLKPSKNGANVRKSSKKTTDKTGSKPQTQIWHNPDGSIRRTQVDYQSRSWQAPFRYEINM